MRRFSLQVWLRETYSERRFQKPERIARSKKHMDAAMLLLALVSLLVYEVTERDAGRSPFSILFDIMFVADYLLRLYYTGRDRNGFSWRRSRMNYATRWYGITDWVAVFPPLAIDLLAGHFGVAGLAPVARFVRLARILRILRSLRLLQSYEGFHENAREFLRKINRELIVTISIVMVVAAAGIISIWYLERNYSGPHLQSYGDLERNDSGSQPKSFGDTVYWGILSLMGAPEDNKFNDTRAQLISIGVIFIGLAFFGLMAGSITGFLMDNVRKHMQGLKRFEGKGQIVICGWNSRITELLLHLRKIPDLNSVILLYDRGNLEEDISEFERIEKPTTGEYLRVQWVRGNPRNMDDLRRVNIQRAASVIVLADLSKSNLDEDDIDARSLITMEMIHEVLRDTNGAAGGLQVASPDITVELLTVQAIPLARKYATHVVYADDLICQYITLDTHSREASVIYERLIDPTDQNVYLIDITDSASIEGVDPVATLDDVFRLHGAMFLGIHLSSDVFIRITSGNRHFYDLLNEANLLDAAEQACRSITGSHLREVVDSENEPPHRGGIQPEGFPILNPVARRELINEVLVRCRSASLKAGELKAIGMSLQYPQGLSL